jgi:hypothetical protein
VDEEINLSDMEDTHSSLREQVISVRKGTSNTRKCKGSLKTAKAVRDKIFQICKWTRNRRIFYHPRKVHLLDRKKYLDDGTCPDDISA